MIPGEQQQPPRLMKVISREPPSLRPCKSLPAGGLLVNNGGSAGCCLLFFFILLVMRESFVNE